MDSDGQDIYVKLRAGGISTNFWDSLNVCRYPAKYRGRAPAASWCTGIHLFHYLHRNSTYACKWLQNVPHTKIHLSPLSDGVGRKTGYLGVLALSGESIAHVFSAPGRKLEPNGTVPWDFRVFGAKKHPLAGPESSGGAAGWWWKNEIFKIVQMNQQDSRDFRVADRPMLTRPAGPEAHMSACVQALTVVFTTCDHH